MSVKIQTGVPFVDNLFPLIQSFLEQDTLDLLVDNERIHGYRSPDSRAIWIRDYSDMFRGFRYFESDLKSVVQHFADTQKHTGQIFDYVTTFPEKLPCERENWTKYVRVPVEADVEFRFVKAAFLAWQSTGDDLWMQTLLPKLEKALRYAVSHPWRWDEKSRLIKRAYTIDTWDFAYTAGRHPWLQFQIDDRTFWGIMHGDNSGYFEAFQLLSKLFAYFGQGQRAQEWTERAEHLKKQMNKICWNGRFYTHFVKLTPVKIPGVDESKQLSLSNPMAINRGVASHAMAVSILREYLLRKKERQAVFEWFSIDPPFPDGIFGDEKLVQGAYINGGIFPLVGGELAKAAFEHGFEWYGVDILQRYYDLIAQTGETYLWYFPDGRPSTVDTSTSPEAMPTDGWGSSAMAYALVEGLAGVSDTGRLWDALTLSPRWPAAKISQAEVEVGYDVSNRGVHYTYNLEERSLSMNIRTPEAQILARVLLPEGQNAQAIFVNGRPVEFSEETIESSRYAIFQWQNRGEGKVRIALSLPPKVLD